MALISVDRTPTILGARSLSITKYTNGPDAAPYAWQVYRSGDFISQGGGSTLGNRRFHTILLSNNGPTSVLFVFDTSTSATANLVSVPLTGAMTLNIGEVLELHVGALGGATGIRRIMFINNAAAYSYVNAVPYAPNVVTSIDCQVGFYTAQQSA